MTAAPLTAAAAAAMAPKVPPPLQPQGPVLHALPRVRARRARLLPLPAAGVALQEMVALDTAAAAAAAVAGSERGEVQRGR